MGGVPKTYNCEKTKGTLCTLICTNMPGILRKKRDAEETSLGNSLAVQGLGPRALTAEGVGSIPGWGTKIPQAVQHSQKHIFLIKKKRFVYKKKLHTYRDFRGPGEKQRKGTVMKGHEAGGLGLLSRGTRGHHGRAVNSINHVAHCLRMKMRKWWEESHIPMASEALILKKPELLEEPETPKESEAETSPASVRGTSLGWAAAQLRPPEGTR